MVFYLKNQPVGRGGMAKLNDSDSSYFQNRGEVNRTSTTFIARLQDRNSDAWKDFMEFYVPLIQYWCRRKKDRLTRVERQDILQDVLQRVSASIEKFDLTHEERSFRGWLRRITENRICDYLQEKAKKENTERLYSDIGIENIAAPFPVLSESDAATDPECEAEEQRILLKQVLNRIKSEFREKSWEVFRLLVVVGQDSSEVAQTMNMMGDAVRQIRSRILKRIREEYAKFGIEATMPIASIKTSTPAGRR